MNRTPIEWTDFSSNPVIYRNAEGHVVWACVKKSAGCTHCYAETLAKRYGRGGPFNAGEMATLTPELNLPEIWKLLSAKRVGGKDVAGSRVFVEDMSDLFGEWIPDVLLDRLMAVFALRRDVTYQLLTKRADRARRYFDVVGSDTDEWRDRWDDARRWLRAFLLEHGERGSMGRAEYVGMVMSHQAWPLKNVHLGTSVENQQTADERIPQLLQTPAATRWVSYEPALGPVDFANLRGGTFDAMTGCGDRERLGAWEDTPALDWIVVGGESGHGARPFDVAWARQTVQQCKAAGVPVFVKQLGANPILGCPEGEEGEGQVRDDGSARYWTIDFIKSKKGGDMSEWPEDLRVRELPEVRA